MKKALKHLTIGIVALGAISQAQAVVSLSLEPVLQSIGVGGPASVNLVISGLGNLASPSLGGFDIDLSYDPGVVFASSLTFGTLLDLGSSGSFRGSDISTPGLVHLDEVSFESADDLNAAQPDSFTLATLDFTGVGPGLSPLIFGNVSLSDESGTTILGFAINTAAIEVTGQTIPDSAATGWLLGGACAGLLMLQTRSTGKKELA